MTTNFFSPLSFVAVFGFEIRDPRSGIRDPGSVIRDPGWVKIRIRDGLKSGSGINIPDPQHWFGCGVNWFRIAVTELLYDARSGVSDVVYPETGGGGDWTDGQLTSSGGSLQEQVSSLRTQLARLQGTVDQVASGEWCNCVVDA
jgi:hypothetical protein